VRLGSGNDDFHDEQEGRVNVHGVSSLHSKSEVIRNKNGNVTVKSEGRNRARVVLNQIQSGKREEEEVQVSAVNETIEYKNGAYSCRMTSACTIQCSLSGRELEGEK
jgi:hypothetical protein